MIDENKLQAFYDMMRSSGYEVRTSEFNHEKRYLVERNGFGISFPEDYLKLNLVKVLDYVDREFESAFQERGGLNE